MSAAQDDDFLWNSDNDSIVVPEQPGLAVYSNVAGAIVVREQGCWPDEDVYLIVQPANAERLAAAILALADQLLGTTSAKDATAAARQRRRRQKQRDSHASVTPGDRDIVRDGEPELELAS